ncbi:glucan 1,3-beta-glucosidase [Diplocarpon rosae]|nr:glucan 1,3-beta-glucosidase [Diplocarpon rosae]
MENRSQYRGSVISTHTTPQPPGTPESRTDPFHDQIIPAAPASVSNPFSTPFGSRPVSSFGSSSAVRGALPSRYFHSRRVRKGEVEKPWMDKKDPKEKWVTIIPMIGLLVGFGIAGFLVYDGLSSVIHHKYCEVMSDDFSGGTLNPNIWTMEQEVGGFGNGQFEQTTADPENVFIQDGKLVIKPTLQDEALITSNTVINLTTDGTCTSDVPKNCAAVTNITAGTIVPPVRSGRINTKKGGVIRYGRVEVTATLPSGDWLWPAIWMLPVNDTYGPWPKSGEIDIAESRGNNHTYAQGGNNIVSSALHWGPDSANDAWWRTNEFYLILNVAVGGTNGWFEDGKSGKPWLDGSPTAKSDFWSQRNQWLPTWQGKNAGQMTVSKVTMWQQCDGDENDGVNH